MHPTDTTHQSATPLPPGTPDTGRPLGGGHLHHRWGEPASGEPTGENRLDQQEQLESGLLERLL
jgi:hypothetical protein